MYCDSWSSTLICVCFCVCVRDKHLLCVLRQAEAQVDDRKACELLSQVKHLRVFFLKQFDTHGDPLAVPSILCQMQTLATITVARIAALSVYANPLAHIHLTLVHVCNDRLGRLY